MNTASFAMRKYNERDQFCEGFKIDATKKEQDASKMFIGGLTPDLTKQTLLEYLSQFGEIVDFIIKIDPNTGLSRGFGFVLFKDSSTVDKVLQVKEHKVGGKKVEFKRARAIESQFPIKKVFVGGLNPQMSEEKIRAYFGTFGQIENIELPLCSNIKKRRAFGFIKYTEEKPARKVLETRFHFIGSSRCEVKMALPKDYLTRQQSRSSAKAMVRERKAVSAAEFERHWGERGNQSFHLMTNSDAQETNLGVQRASPYTFRENSDVSVANDSGFRDIPSEFQANSNVVVTKSSAFMASLNAFRPNSNTVGVNHYAPGSNLNAFSENQYALGESPNSFRTSRYNLEPYPNAFGNTSQYDLVEHPNDLGISERALAATPNGFWKNQYLLGTYPNALGVSQYASGTSPNALGVSQYTASTNSNAFRPNHYAFAANPYDFQTNKYVLSTSPTVFRRSPFPMGTSPNAFGPSQYAVGATQNAFGANQDAVGANGNFCGVIGSGRNTEAFNFSQAYDDSSNAYNTLPAFPGSNGDYFFLYSYGAYDLESVLNCNVHINQSSLLGNGYQGIYSPF